MKLTARELRELVSNAEEAFWRVIADHFPHARTGDLSIDQTIRFSMIATESVEEWILNNVPDA
jgi:hypothetical protein